MSGISTRQAIIEYTDMESQPVRILSMAYHANDIVLALDTGDLIIADFSDLHIRQYVPDALASHIWSVALSADGSHLLTGGAQPIAYLWLLDSGQIPRGTPLLGIVPPHSDGVVTAVGITSFQGDITLALGTHDGYLTLHTLDGLVREFDQAIGLGSPIWSIAFSQDGSLIAAGTATGDVHVFRTQDILDYYAGGERPISHILPILTASPEGPDPIVGSLAFSPDQNYIAVGHPRGISLWATCPSDG